MPVVDLSILRCATYEMFYVEDIDPATSINEAVEIAKSYSTPDSPKFINGVLDNIRKKRGSQHLNTLSLRKIHYPSKNTADGYPKKLNILLSLPNSDAFRCRTGIQVC